MDPTQPLQANVRIDSPQVVVYRLWYQRPGDAGWTLFANGTDQDSSGASGQTFTVGPLPAGSLIGYQFILSGNPVTALRVELTMAQGGVTLPEGALVLEGTTDDTGVAVRQGQVAP
ncbi:MAG TPA: hypothetical protein VGO40_07320 [Longimicrobium sp.]|jgi:hypothetical protein|nr:hypothetical protein [Longimicrobium sp.]